MPADDAPPIATATVARLYMEQGKLDQAEQIYRGLLRDSPQDPRILQGIEEVRRRRDELLGASSDDVVALEPLPDGELTCRWRVSVEGRARAGLVLGGNGTLVLRIVAFPIAPESRPRDLELDRDAGQASLTPPEGASLVGAAVGLRAGDGTFVSITHCPPVSLAR